MHVSSRLRYEFESLSFNLHNHFVEGITHPRNDRVRDVEFCDRLSPDPVHIIFTRLLKVVLHNR